MKDSLTLCHNCNCMTKTINKTCGKCGTKKDTIKIPPNSSLDNLTTKNWKPMFYHFFGDEAKEKLVQKLMIIFIEKLLEVQKKGTKMKEVIKKNESYYKEVLSKVFGNDGIFQQFEFTSFGGSSRPDYVILTDKEFIYFEIKTEFDTFQRFNSQYNDSIGFFNKVYLVIPESKLNEFISYQSDQIGKMGVYVLEDLEKGIKKARIEPNYNGYFSISKIKKILWKEDLFYYVKLANPDVWCVDKQSGKKIKLNQMDCYDLDKFFDLYYSDKDAFQILSDVLKTRKYNLRQDREKRKQLSIIS